LEGSYESQAAVQHLSAPVNENAHAMLNIPHPSESSNSKNGKDMQKHQGQKIFGFCSLGGTEQHC